MPLHLFAPGSASASQNIAAALTRRSFLALLAAGCAEKIVRIPTARRDNGNWALISDTHIGPDCGAVNRGSCMATNLQQVVEQVVSASPDHVLFNGDIALASGQTADYGAFQRLISPLSSTGVPMHLTLGNHDDRRHFCDSLAMPHTSLVPGKSVSEFQTSNVRWLLLDSLDKVNEVRGSLGAAQRQWLADRLDAAPKIPTIVCLHHNPEPLLVGLRDTFPLLDILLPRRQVKAVLFGHTHRFNLWEQEGLHFVNLPAVGYKLPPASPLGWVNATIKSGGMRLDFQPVNRRDPNPFLSQTLSWRRDA